MSLSISDTSVRWVYGQVTQSNVLTFRSILASGGFARDLSEVEQPSALSVEQIRLILETVLGMLGKSHPKPQSVVFAIPANRAFMCELVAPEDEDEDELRFQIEDLLEEAAGENTGEMVFDWQNKLDTPHFEQDRSLVVAAVHKRVMDALLEACSQLKLNCLGVTLDNLAALNGYLQAAGELHKSVTPRFLLYGELSTNRVRLSVFIEGFLFHESQELSKEGFSAVQAVTSLEKLLGTWARGDQDQGEGAVKLILGGSLMHSKSVEATIKRSTVLAPKVYEIRPRAELANRWHEDVVAFGALEGLPCA